MTIQVSISPGASHQLNHKEIDTIHESFHLHFIAKDEDCRKLWTISARDEFGDLKRYKSIQQALIDATEKMATYSLK